MLHQIESDIAYDTGDGSRRREKEILLSSALDIIKLVSRLCCVSAEFARITSSKLYFLPAGWKRSFAPSVA
jgi:hypothetical protein